MRRDPGVHLCSNGAYWQYWFWDSSGRKVIKSLGSKADWPKRSALAECNRLAAELATSPGKRDVRESPTLGPWLDRYAQLRTDLAENTADLHRQTAALLREHFGADVRIDRIKRDDAAGFVAWLSRRKKPRGEELVTESTVRKHVTISKVIFGHAVRLDLVPFNPFDREKSSAPKVDKDWRYVTVEETDRILETCPSDGWRVLTGLCRFAGLRLGEALRLDWPEVDWDDRSLTVKTERGHETTKQRRRVVPITPKLHAILLAAFEAAPPGARSVVGIGGDNHRRDFAVIARRAGLTPWGKPFHTLRKNCETDWLAKFPVMDVCDWLGHDPTVAREHYHQTRRDTFQAAAGIEQPKAAEVRP